MDPSLQSEASLPPPPRIRSRKRVAALAVVIAVIVVIAALFVVEAEKTQVQTLIAANTPIGNGPPAMNASIQFTTNAPGLLAGSWAQFVSPGWPAATAYVYLANQCVAPPSDYPNPTCEGPAVWGGPVNGGAGSLESGADLEVYSGSVNLTLAAGTYTFVLVGENASSTVGAEVYTPFTLTPTPWWWL